MHIKRLIDKLEDMEEKLKDSMIPFLCKIFSNFHDNKDVWMRAVDII